MNDQVFALQPFATTPILSDLEIIGTVTRHDSMLVLAFTLLGAVDEVDIPPPAKHPVRNHELWKNTCFEFFLGLQDTAQYWEFNLSPSGDWNVYRFDDYRQGMAEESAFNALPIHIETEPDAVSLSLSLDLDDIIPIGRPLDVAISTVIQSKTGDLSYWALTHSGSEADFHRRDGFTLCLEAG